MPEMSKVLLSISKAFQEEIVSKGSKIFDVEELLTLNSCIQCGSCVGSCPSGRKTAWRVRLIIREAQLGLRERALSKDELWHCTTCYTCQERCPREVMTTDIVRIIRNIAFEEGYVQPRHVLVAENFFKTGHSIPMKEEIKEMRRDLGLNEIPPTTLAYRKSLEEVKRLAEYSGFKEKLEKVKK